MDCWTALNMSEEEEISLLSRSCSSNSWPLLGVFSPPPDETEAFSAHPHSAAPSHSRGSRLHRPRAAASHSRGCRPPGRRPWQPGASHSRRSLTNGGRRERHARHCISGQRWRERAGPPYLPCRPRGGARPCGRSGRG